MNACFNVADSDDFKRYVCVCGKGYCLSRDPELSVYGSELYRENLGRSEKSLLGIPKTVRRVMFIVTPGIMRCAKISKTRQGVIKVSRLCFHVPFISIWVVFERFFKICAKILKSQMKKHRNTKNHFRNYFRFFFSIFTPSLHSAVF